MWRLSPRITRNITSSVAALFSHVTSSSYCGKQYLNTCCEHTNIRNLLDQAIPGDFLKWRSLGFCRTSRFATGFTPLQPKPLDSIIDIERAKKLSSDDLISIWDDVISSVHFLSSPNCLDYSSSSLFNCL